MVIGIKLGENVFINYNGTMPPRSARLTRLRYAKRNSSSTSKKPTNWASDWWQRPRNNKLKQRRNNHVQFEL